MSVLEPPPFARTEGDALKTRVTTLENAETGFVPTSRQVIAGSGLTGGGALTGNVTLAANVTSVAGRTGAVTLAESDIASLVSDLSATEKAANKAAAGGYASLDSATRVVQPVTDLSAFGIYSVTGKGSTVVADGVTDDTAALNTFIASTPVGATILFPAKTIGISAPIRYLGGRRYLGEGWALGSGATIKQLNGSNMTETAGVSGLFVANGWYNNASVCDAPVAIHNIAFSGNHTNNSSSNACGVVVMNFWTVIEQCYFNDIPLDGIRITDTGRNGSTVINNSASENRILRCKINIAQGNGITQVCANNISNQDGFCEDNLINTVGGRGISFQRGSGWYFQRNHMYGVGTDGMYLDNCFATIVANNEVEDFGGAGLAGTYYQGIYVSQLDGRGTSVTGNYIGCAEPNGGSGGGSAHFQYLHAVSGVSQTDAHVALIGNTLHGPASPTAGGLGLVVENGSGGVLHARVGMNDTTSINTTSYVPALFPSAVAGANNGTSPPAPTVTGASDNRRGSVQFGSGSSPAAGAQVVVSYPATLATAPITPVIGAVNAATAAKQPYVTSLTQTGFTIAFAVAPAASQSGATYEVSYVVLD